VFCYQSRADLLAFFLCTTSRALLLTVDSNVGDLRQSTEKVKGTRFSAEPGIKSGAFEDDSQYHDAKQNWDDLVWLKELAGTIPIYLKGVSSIEVRLSFFLAQLQRLMGDIGRQIGERAWTERMYSVKPRWKTT
jgi:hypothetical protein